MAPNIVCLSAALLAVLQASQAFIVPSTFTFPGAHKDFSHHQDNSGKDVVNTLPIPKENPVERLKNLQLGVSKPWPFPVTEEDIEDARDKMKGVLKSLKKELKGDVSKFKGKVAEITEDLDADELEEKLRQWWADVIPTMEEMKEVMDDTLPSKQELEDALAGYLPPSPPATQDDQPGNALYSDELLSKHFEPIEDDGEFLTIYWYGDDGTTIVDTQRIPLPTDSDDDMLWYHDDDDNEDDEELLLYPAVQGGPAKFWDNFKEEAKPMIESIDTPHNRGRARCMGSRLRHALRTVASGLRTFFTSFLLPVLVGVAAGMMASLFGMLIGTFCGWAWVKLRGARRSEPQPHVALSGQDGCVVEEKVTLLTVDGEAADVEDSPPIYIEKE